jgi:hypothetical protein
MSNGIEPPCKQKAAPFNSAPGACLTWDNPPGVAGQRNATVAVPTWRPKNSSEKALL